MKDMTKRIKTNEGRIDANTNWRVSESLAADCEKASLHPGWATDILQKWRDLLLEVKNRHDSNRAMEILPKKNWKTDEAFWKKKPSVARISGYACLLGMDLERGKAEMERLHEEVKQGKSKSGKRERRRMGR